MALFGKFSTHRKVERLIRDGVGVHEACWRLESDHSENADALVEDVVAWVRSAMGHMRRPYGIDHIALALAARDDSGRVICSNSLGVLRPASFYEAEGPAQVRAFLGDAGRVLNGNSGDMIGALLSLGDIAYELNARGGTSKAA
ncbi:MAG: hypothetical protein AB7J35_10820 [Dehalococcoidia bacterium]